MTKTMDEKIEEEGIWIPLGEHYECLVERNKKNENDTTVIVGVKDGSVSIVTYGGVSISTNGKYDGGKN